MVRSPSHRSHRSRRTQRTVTALSTVAFVSVLAMAQPSYAAWEGSRAEEVTAQVVDAVIVRPLATVRVVVGAALLVPASLFASPSGKEGIGIAADVLVTQPIEYAFDRELGDF